MSAKDYQNGLIPIITNRFPNQGIEHEWVAFRNQGRSQYSPRVDIAVGPFSTPQFGNQRLAYNDLLDEPSIIGFIEQINREHCNNMDILNHNRNLAEALYANENARCLFSLEIENENSKKHIMGSIVNAASLGRIGIGIAYNPSTFRAFKRIVAYFHFLRSVDKNTYNTSNFFIVTREQFDSVIAAQNVQENVNQ